MPPWINSIKTYFLDPSLKEFGLLLISLLLGCYLLALLLVKALPSQTTIIHRCRSAWGMAILIHLLATLAVFVYWYFGHRMLADFGKFALAYATLAVVDLILGLALLRSAHRFTSYRRF